MKAFGGTANGAKVPGLEHEQFPSLYNVCYLERHANCLLIVGLELEFICAIDTIACSEAVKKKQTLTDFNSEE